MRVLAAIALLLGACKFTPGELTPDTMPPTNVTVAFAAATTLTDENSGTVQVHVVLSEAATDNVTVTYTFTGGSASKGTDFMGTDGTLSFAPGDTDKTIDVTIAADGDNSEGNETFDINLSNPTGAKLGTPTKNTVTISGTPVPRVSFMTTSDSADETAASTITVVLDIAPMGTVTVDLARTGTATDITDYTLSTTTVTFAANEMSKQVTLTPVNDTADEEDETAILTLVNATGAVVANTNMVFTRTITNTDSPPSVSFQSATSSVAENVAGGMVNVTVQLSPASGKTVTVPFTDSGGNATPGAGNDYTIATASPLMFPPGTTTQTITININNDTTSESNETIVLNLGAITNGTAVAPMSHTLTINDDDPDCEGNGNYRACFALSKIVTGGLNLTGTIDTTVTTGSAMCQTPDTGGTAAPNTCWIIADSITISGALTVTGGRNLALIAKNGLTVNFNIDASSHVGGTSGPGANSGMCDAYVDFPNAATSQNGAGGGAGGSFRSAGGNGSSGGANSPNGGGAAVTTSVATAPTSLRGGCAGEAGGAATNGNGPGPAGNGGGGIYLFAGGTLTFGNNVVVNASGGGGGGGPAGNGGGNDAGGGGGGGGSGGMIKLTAGTFSIGTGVKIFANGGGGGAGGDDNTSGGSGANATAPGTVAGGGSNSSAGAAGAAGFAGSTQAASATDITGNNAGGGGGGGGGHLESNAALTGATTSAGAVLNNVP